MDSSKLRDRPWSIGGVFGRGLRALGRLEGLRLEGKIDLDVTVALLLEVLLDIVERAEGGADFLEDDSCFDCRLRLLLLEGIEIFGNANQVRDYLLDTGY